MNKINRIAAALLVTAALAGCATEAGDDDTETPTQDVTTETDGESEDSED